MFRLAILLLAGFFASPTAQPAGLRIVVIEGEDGVNIIQQKTAVRPIVEVRDRNDLPVAGALVTFSIPGGQAASFGGVSTLTIATNAAGRAAATGLTPTTAGAFQIQVQAAFQGQVATATIAQTNVLTAAQAAAQAAGASGGGTSAGSTGGAAGGGGGVSATTIGVIGAAVGGGALAAAQLAGKEEPAAATAFTGPFSGQIVSTIVSQSTCTVTRSVNGTIKMTLDSQAAAAISGKAEITGTDVVIGSSCGGASGTTSISYMFNVTGTPANFGFQQQSSDMRPLDVDARMTVSSTTNVLLEAALSGGVITGTLKYQEQSTITGPNPTSRESATGSFPFTLR
jgi:hypothetical protein